MVMPAASQRPPMPTASSQMQQQSPDATGMVYDRHGNVVSTLTPLGGPYYDSNGMPVEMGQQVNTGGGGGGASTQAAMAQPVTTTTSTTTSSGRTTDRSHTEGTTLNVSRTYFEVPTPEEFLNDFTNSYATYINTLQRNGSISTPEAVWLSDNMEMVFNDFIAEQGRRAQAGEDIFAAMGGPEEKGSEVAGELILTRPGFESVSESRTEGSGSSTNSSSTTSTTTQAPAANSTVPNQAPVKSAQDTLKSQALANQAATNPEVVATSTSTSSGGSSWTNLSTSKHTNKEVEELYEVDKIFSGYKYSPMDYLDDHASSRRLRMLYEGQRGIRAANNAPTTGTTAARLVH